ncbi:MAG: CvpA family protein [Helicobacter sp.]|nr:CvpA family protein [Helicobacter sp.]
MSGFNYLDIALAILIILLGIKGIINGLVKEFFGIVGIIGGVWAASLWGEKIGQWFSNNIYDLANSSLIFIVGFVVVLAVVWIAALVLSDVVSRLVGASALGSVNRFLGVLFAMAKVFLILSIIIYALSNVEFIRKPIQEYAEGSALYPVMLRAGATIVRIESVQQLTRDAGQGIDQATQNLTLEPTENNESGSLFSW